MEEENLINDLKKQISNQENQINELKKQLSEKETIINSFPRLCQTSLGRSTSDGKITYRNWWSSSVMGEINGFCENMWFTKFIRHKFPNEDYKINMFSVFGIHDNIVLPMEGSKVFFSGENINYFYQHINEKFGSYALDYVDLAMGFDLINNPKYLRFPLWILWCFPPESTPEIIENKIETWNSLSYEKSKDVALIASHDNWKTRSLIVNDLEPFANISFAGKWKNNTTELWDKFNNNKIDFLKQYKFNICPENSIDTGYVTEKIFDAINSDSIPLYAGGKDYLESKVLNNKAIISWDFDKDNSDSVEIFKNLISDEKSYKEFKDQNILLDSSSKYIIKKFNKLEKHFEKLIY